VIRFQRAARAKTVRVAAPFDKAADYTSAWGEGNASKYGGGRITRRAPPPSVQTPP
jgi:hypothetical protein